MANKAIFFDRDDTLIEDPGYINNPEQVKLLEGVPEALIELSSFGYKLVVVSNQSGVARGIVTEDVLVQIHKRLEQLLAEKGTSLDGIYYCPYHPEGAIPKYRKDSEMRKPKPGMLLKAGKELNIDLKESWMVGNSARDIEAGASVGCRTILLDSRGHEQKIQPGQTPPDYRAVNLKEVVNIIKMQARSQSKPTAPASPAMPAVEEKPPATQEAEPAPAQQVPPIEEERFIQEGPEEEEPTTNQLLQSILDQLRQTQRTNMFGEFYISRFVAWFIQMLVFGCLLASISFLMSPVSRLNAVLISLGFAIVFQLMALTFFIMQGPK
jgi:D-glycero-D-manno-heptose 1,7-bisphosphate phosphatase